MVCRGPWVSSSVTGVWLQMKKTLNTDASSIPASQRHWLWLISGQMMWGVNIWGKGGYLGLGLGSCSCSLQLYKNMANFSLQYFYICTLNLGDGTFSSQVCSVDRRGGVTYFVAPSPSQGEMIRLIKSNSQINFILSIQSLMCFCIFYSLALLYLFFWTVVAQFY